MQHIFYLKSSSLKILLFAVFIGLITSNSHAQFLQKGMVLEYHGNMPKTTYTEIISLSFHGAASTSAKNGLFELYFNQLKKGDIVGSFEININDEKYVLFNRSSLQRWILTSDIDMEVLLCKKSRVDNIAKVYTENNSALLKKNYEEALRRIEEAERDLQKTEKEKNDLIKEKNELKFYYEKELSEIKANAIAFAYVDETKLDSLERLKRYYMLNGDIDSALIIGRKANYARSAADLMNNSRLLDIEKKQTIDQLFNVSEYVQQHIENLMTRKERYDSLDEKEIIDNFKILIEINDYLIGQYSFQLRCEESFLEELKNKHRQICNKYASFIFSVNKGNGDYYEQKKQLALCLGYATDEVLVDKIQERLEMFPDFVYYTPEKDTVYCHILDDSNSVSICDYHPKFNKFSGNFLRRGTVKIPSIIPYSDKEYLVKKIGHGAFRNCCVCDWENSPFFHTKGMFYDRFFDTVIIPNTVTEIGRQAFEFSVRDTVIIPSSVKIIKDEAFFTYFGEIGFVIPEGVEYLGEEAFACGDCNTYYSSTAFTGDAPERTLVLPSTLKKMDPNAFGYLGRPWKVILDKNNKNFKLINGLLYSSDSMTAYPLLWPYHPKSVFIPNNCDYYDVSSFTDNFLEEYCVSPNHPKYSVYKGVLYNKDMSQIVDVPQNMKIIHIAPTIKNISKVLFNVDSIFYIEKVQINKDAIIYLPHEMDDSLKLVFYNVFSKELLNGQLFLAGKQKPVTMFDFASVLDNYKCLDNTAYKKVAQWYAKQKRIDKVVELYTKSTLSSYEKASLLLSFGNNCVNGDSGFPRDCKMAFDFYNESLQQYNTPQAACNLGFLYNEGLGVPRDVNNAIKWYRKSIEWGLENKEAVARLLGSLYYYGDGIEKNDSLAFYFFTTAAEGNDADAYNYLGIMYWDGSFTSRNAEKAIDSYQKAISYGDKKHAPYNLGMIYYQKGEYHDMEKAESLMEQSADNGSSAAMNMVAYMKALSKGTNHNLPEALYFINKALSISPNNIHYLDTKGEMLLMCDRVDEARLILREMIKIDSLGVEKLKPESNYLKAIMYEKKEEIFLKLLELGDSINSPYLLGNIYFQNKELIKAKAYYEIASNHGNDNAKVALYILNILMKEEKYVWESRLIGIWQHTPIITESPINEISFISDNRIVGYSEKGKACYIWSSNGQELVYENKYNQLYGPRATFSPTGKYVIIEGTVFDGRNHPMAQIWDVNKDSLMYSITHYDGTLRRVCISQDDKFFLSYDKDSGDYNNKKYALRLRDIGSGKIIFSKYFRSFVDYAGFSPDGKYIIAIVDKNIYIWDSKIGEEVQTYDNKYREMDNAIMSPDNSKMICYKRRNHWVDIWNVRTGEKISTIRHSAPIEDACIDCTSQYVATASADSTAAIWDISSGQRLYTFNQMNWRKKLRFSPNGKVLAVSCSNAILLWDVENGTQINPLMIHNSIVLDFNFSPDGKIIVSSTADNVCRLWNVETGKEITSSYIPAK